MDRRRTPVAAAAPPAWGLYRFHDAAGELLYIGISRRDQLARLIEHLRRKPWAPEIAGWQMDPVTYSTEVDARVAERRAIHAELPRHNDQHNHANPHRVVWRSGTPRRARPAARPQSRAGRRRRTPRRWWRRRSTWIALVWLATTGGMWAVIGGQVDAGTGAGLSAAVAAGLTRLVFKR